MTNKTLRALAKDYAQGVTDRDTYRKARTDLIEGIIAGNIKVEPIDFPPPIDLDDGDPTVESAITQINPEQFTKKPAQPKTTPAPPPLPPAKETHHHWLIGSGIVALLCLIILVFLFIGKKDKVKEKETAYDYELSELTVKDTTTTSDKSAADYLVEGFLKQNNWSDEYTGQFINNWNNLSIQEQTAALNSTAISRLSNAIYKQLLNERALLGLGNDAEVVAKQQALVDFANKLGIDDSRLIVKGKVEEATKENTESKQIEMPAKDQPSDTIDETDSTIDPDSAVIPPEEAIRASPAGEEQNDIIIQQPTSPETLSKTTTEKIPEVEKNTTSESKENSATKQQSASNKNACRAELAKKRKPYCRDVINGVGNGPTLVVIRSGKFKMGGQNPYEHPVHEVTIGNPFALSVNEITYGEYKLFCKDSQYSCPEQPWVGEDYPVVNVSWADAQAYVKWLTEKTGNTYRLPSEAEWEYSARAGTTTIYPFGDEVLITDAVFSDRKQLSSPLPKTDRSINRNKFRLYHMMGNVREWVADNWQENYSSVSNDGTAFENGTEMRVVRGGSFNDGADALRSGARDKLSADARDKFTGFRVLQEIN